jgi:hypothetical protein
MPGLLRGVARTAVVAGTATAVSGRVQRRQASRYADKDAEIAAEQQRAYDQQMGGQPEYQQVPAQAAPPDKLEQLSKLGQLKDQGVLTEAEFAQEKAKILAL